MNVAHRPGAGEPPTPIQTTSKVSELGQNSEQALVGVTSKYGQDTAQNVSASGFLTPVKVQVESGTVLKPNLHSKIAVVVPSADFPPSQTPEHGVDDTCAYLNAPQDCLLHGSDDAGATPHTASTGHVDSIFRMPPPQGREQANLTMS